MTDFNIKFIQMVNIYPAKGSLLPRCSQMIKVAFTSFGEPAFYDMDMICEVCLRSISYDL